MLDWQAIVENYIIKYSNQIRKATRPLKERFGISYFTYHRIDASGKYTVLVDRPDWAERYVSEKIFLQDPYLRHPSVYKSGICFIESFGSKEYKEMVLREGKSVLDIDMGVILIQKSEDEVEFFGFTGNTRSSSLQSLYLNHSQILQSFAAHFKKELSPILRLMQEETASLIDLKGKDFYCKDSITPQVNIELFHDYFKDLGMKELVDKATSFSLRERQCLKLLMQGKSAKETAKLLKLSSRTVEFYFENIKNKSNCLDKREVLEFARNLEKLGLL